MTSDQIFLGVGLILVLAVGSQVVASRLRIPALIVLLPAGFIAGALTSDVNPNRLLGSAFQPLVSLAVALILYEAGLGLDLRKLYGHTRRVVIRLILLGVPITWVVVALVADPVLGMSKRAAVMLGAILVVSGPTVVGPILRFVRPGERLQRLLTWEGSLIDPVGAILGVVVFNAIVASTRHQRGDQIAQFFLSFAVGLAGGALGAVVLWLLLRKLRLGEVLGATAQLAVVIAVAAGCDIIRDDSGLIAAIVIGLAMASTRAYDVPVRRPFAETLIDLTLGLLFVSIAATVTPASVRHLVLPTLVLVAVLVLATRPLIAFLSSLGTDLTRGERGFVGWMAPRGIVAAATASTFAVALTNKGIPGAGKILPATFLVIVATVTVYGLTAAPVARRLHVNRPSRTRPLLVGGDRWVVDLGTVLQSAGLPVLMWAPMKRQRDRIRSAGLDLAPGELLAAATGRGAQLAGVTAVLLLTIEDDFNALASTVLEGNVDGSVYRLAPPLRSSGVVAPYMGGEILFGGRLTGATLLQRHRGGAQISLHVDDAPAPPDHDVMFVIRASGRLEPVTRRGIPTAQPGDVTVLLGPPTPHPVAPRPRISVWGMA